MISFRLNKIINYNYYRDVVPYNPYLLAKYECHLNCKITVSLKSVIYIHKYIRKRSDKATVQISGAEQQQCNEIKEFLDACYVSASEACWRLFEFNIDRKSVV